MQPTVREEEEEDPDIPFNFKGDNREMIFEERHGTIFGVDPEITFNFRSPQTLVGDGAYKERRRSYPDLPGPPLHYGLSSM